MTVESGIVFRAECDTHIERPYPIVACKHFVDHHFRLRHHALSLERDAKAFWDAVGSVGEHHARGDDGLGVYMDNNGVGGNVADFGVTYEIVDDEADVEGVVATVFCRERRVVLHLLLEDFEVFLAIVDVEDVVAL